MTKTPLAWDDTVLPFQFDRADLRGRVARLDGVLQDVLRQHHYPAVVEALLAEMTLLAALIGQTMKLRWKLSLQVRGKGAIRILAADYYAPAQEGAPAEMRAWASYDAERLEQEGPGFAQIGEGYFAVLIDQGEGNVPYQGITALTGTALADCAAQYFINSEQLPSRFALAYGRSQVPGGAEHWRAGGILLQTVPKASLTPVGAGEQVGAAEILQGTESEDWTRANALLDTVEELELIGPSVSPETLLTRLFHEEQPRVFAAQKVRFGCTCSEAKVRQSLSIYSAKDIRHMTTDAGTVTADCQFCGAHYVLDPASVGFEATKAPDGTSLPQEAKGDA